MKRFLALLLILVLTSCTATPNLTVHEAKVTKALSQEDYYEFSHKNPVPEETLKAIRHFAINIAPLIMQETENDNYSPLSLYIALSMVASGAETDSADQLFTALGRNIDYDSLSKDMGLIQTLLNLEDGPRRIQLVNSIWNQTDFPFKDDYIQRLTTDFQASLFEVDFQDSATPKQMQDWVAEQTNDLLKPEFNDLDNVVSVLLNTLYFKDSWLNKFEKESTESEVFHGIQGDVPKDFMKQRQRMGYIHKDDLEGVILPFQTSRIILLKQPGTQPVDILKNYDYSSLVDSVNYQEVIFSLPKFSFEKEYDLKQPLMDLGVKDIFDPDLSDLSGMSPVELFVSKIYQQSFIDLDEDGVEAAAVTVVMEEPTAMPIPEEPIELRFDEPFLFIIESPEGLPLFIGALNY